MVGLVLFDLGDWGQKSKSGWAGLLIVLVGFVGLFEIVGLVGLFEIVGLVGAVWGDWAVWGWLG